MVLEGAVGRKSLKSKFLMTPAPAKLLLLAVTSEISCSIFDSSPDVLMNPAKAELSFVALTPLIFCPLRS